MLTTTYEIDLVPGGVPVVIHVSQYDVDTRILHFNLINSEGALSVPSAARAAIRGTKPDGNGFDYTAAATIGATVSVDVTVTAQMTAVAGRVFCELYLYTGTPPTTTNPSGTNYKQLATANFIIYVERAALDKGTLKSDSEIRQLIDVVDRTDELLAAAQDIEDAYETYSSKSVFYAEAQSLTAAQKRQARENINALDIERIAQDYSLLSFPVSAGTFCTRNGGVWMANTDIVTVEAFNSSHWTNVPYAFEKCVTVLGAQSLTAAQQAQARANIDAVSGIDERLLMNIIKGTTQTPVFSNGAIQSVLHRDGGGNVVRTDTFNLSGDPMVETRTLATGERLTISTDLTTLASTITYTPAS